MITYPNLNRVAFHIGPVKVYWYGIMYLLGFAAAWWLARRRAAQSGSTWKKADVDDLIFFAMVGVIAGGRIGYVLFYGLTFWANDAWYPLRDRKSTRLNSSHVAISYAVFCLKKKNTLPV